MSSLGLGEFGPYVQLGEATDGGKKPQTASLFKTNEGRLTNKPAAAKSAAPASSSNGQPHYGPVSDFCRQQGSRSSRLIRLTRRRQSSSSGNKQIDLAVLQPAPASARRTSLPLRRSDC